MSCKSLPPLTLSASSISIDDDLWSEILKRLPPKSLCRFRCVCKSWNSLISSSFFINLHRSSPSSTPPGLKPYLRIKPSPNSPDDYTLFRPRETPLEFIGHGLGFPFRPRFHINGLDFPFDSHFSCVDVIHGVVCVSHHALYHIVMWNPAIRMYIDLPIASFYCRAIGFGYHSSNNDFMVVRIRIPDFAYEVYTVRDGFWRVGTIDCNGIKTYGHTSDATGRTGCFVNGTIHWLIDTPDSEAHALLMFDCEHEKFLTMELPEEMTYSQYMPRFLSKLELLKYADMLSALVVLDHIVLWVMEEHTWKKLYGISNNYIHTYIPSLVKLSPYGSDQWIEFLQINGWTSMFSEILSRRVYEESLCLMDHPKAISYPKGMFIYI